MKALSLVALLLTALCIPAQAQTWEVQTSGSSSNVYAVEFINADTGWIGGEGAFIRKTTNGGASWSTQTGQRNITDIHMLGKDTGIAVGGSGGVGVILRTTNGGTGWSTIANSGIAVLWNVSFVNRQLGWAVGAGGTVLRSTNGGVNWTAQNSGITTDLRGHHFINADTGWVVGLSGVIRKTTNGGASWAAQASGVLGNLLKVQFFGASNGWAVGDGTALKTTNGGATWGAQTPSTSGTLLALSFQDFNNGTIAGTAGRIFKTTNGGSSWTSVSTPTTSDLQSIQIINPNAGWASGAQGALLRIKPPVGPTGLTYAANPARYTLGSPIPENIPTLAGGLDVTYSVAPALPAGLALNASTGRVSGTPTANAAPAAYVVTATNPQGSTTATLNLGVGPAPSALTYTPNPASYALGQAIPASAPSLTGDATQWSVAPALPAGLTLNAATGTLVGTPIAVAAARDYTITATNSSGSSTTKALNIAVLQKPSGLTYSPSAVTYIVGTPVTPKAPTVTGTGPFTFDVAPLPSGLFMDGSTGAVGGTPGATAPQASYLVTASNAVGSTTATLAITVDLTSALAPGSASGGFAFDAPGARVAFKAPPHEARTVRVEIRDPAGARVWERTAPVGRDLAWDGTAANGEPAGAGTYLVRLTWRDAADKPLASESRVLPLASKR
jgi:photosystem II stability/assembly factor-like uncharacterized protein